MKVESSSYLALVRPLLKKLLDGLLERYEYASVLATDVEMKCYSVNRSGIRIRRIFLPSLQGLISRSKRPGTGMSVFRLLLRKRRRFLSQNPRNFWRIHGNWEMRRS